MIGGNLSTNAGGINFIRHNSLHANCIGLKAVLANGDVLDNMTLLRKDNTGYDLKHLFIGAEGTLGVITECAVLCGPLPDHKNLVMLACNSFDNVLHILNKAKVELGDVLTAIEFMDAQSLDLVLQNAKQAKDPYDKKFDFYVLIEVATSEA
jgi:D-2-hydroxyglutarate dehydrogenase